MFITDDMIAAVRKHAPHVLAEIGIEDLNDFDGSAMDERARKDAWRKTHTVARSLIEKIRPSTPEAQARSLESAFDGLNALMDELRGGQRDDDSRDPRRPIGADGEVRGGDLPEVGEAYALRSGETFTAWAKRSGEQRGARVRESAMSPGRYLRALILGPKDEAEQRALAGGTDAAGGYTVPTVTSAQLIDLMRAKSVLVRAGAQTVPLTTDETVFAKLASDPVPAWRAENAAVAESDPTFARVLLRPKSLAVLCKASVELMQDSLNLEAELPNILARALAAEVDRAGLHGTGASNQPTGIVNFTGLTANSFAGGALSNYGPLIMARTALHGANEECTGFVMSAREEGEFAGMLDADGQPMRKPEAIASTPMLWTTAMPTNLGTGTNESQIIAGDWSQLMIGMRSEIRIVLLRERYMENLQFGFIAHVRVDFAATRDSAFTVLDAITP